MKVVVTGGSGQLGTLVLERLAADRRISRIVSLDVVPPAIPSPRVEWRIGDLRDPGLERHLEGADALVHLAFIVARRASVATMQAVNVEGSKRIFEEAAAHGVRRIVYTSSVAAYGVAREHPVPIVESTKRYPSPALVYANDKYEVEAYLDVFERIHPEIAVVRLRPGVLLGRRITHVSPAALERRLLVVVGDARGPVVWDEDVADAVVLALLGDAKGAFNIVAAEPLPGEELARLAGFRAVHLSSGTASLMQKASSALSPIAGERRLDLGWLEAARFDMVASSERARAELGWKPRYPTSADVAIAFGKAVRRRPGKRLSLLLGLAPALWQEARQAGELPSELADLELSVHVDLTGPRGEDLALVVKGGKLTCHPGIPRPPDAVLTLPLSLLEESLGGRAELPVAVEDGRLKVRGDPLAVALLDSLVAALRRAGSRRSVRARVTRGLLRAFEGGGTE